MQEIVLPAASAPLPTLLYVLIPGLPFLGFLLNGLLNKKLSAGVAGALGTLTVLGSFGLSLYLFLNFQYQYTVHLFDWISVGSLQIPFSYQVDQLSLIMLLLITGVGSLIHLYSIGYMSHDENVGKFFSFLNLFVFSMLILVLGGNFVILFIGWEGVGLCSYLLIGFWNTNTSYNNAAKKAFIMNRVGDLGFSARHLPHLPDLQHGRIRRSVPKGQPGAVRQLRRGRGHGHYAAVVRGRNGQVGAAATLYLAARRDGRSYPRLGPHPRRHDGDGGRVPGAAAPTSSSPWPRKRWKSWALSAWPRRYLRLLLPWRRTTSRKCWRILPCRSWATCSWRWA